MTGVVQTNMGGAKRRGKEAESSPPLHSICELRINVSLEAFI